MEHYIGLDVASEVSCACVLNSKGKVLKEARVVTEAKVLISLVKSVKRPVVVVFEECELAAWLYAMLKPVADDVYVCDPRQNRNLSDTNKSDKNDARHLAERARGKLLRRVWHGGERVRSLREALRLYQALTKNSTMVKNQIKAVFRGQGVAIGEAAYQAATRGEAVKQLSLDSQRVRVLVLGEVLDVVSEQREAAALYLEKLARREPRYKALKSIDGVGSIYAATFLAEVGSPCRFRTRRQFWKYVGLSVSTYETAEYVVGNDGEIGRKPRAVRTRGLVKSFNRPLKAMFKAMAVQLSATKWKGHYERLIAGGQTKDKALLTLARKAASVTLHVAKTGEKYDETLVFAQQ